MKKSRDITWKTWLYGLFFAIYALLVLLQFLRLGFLGYWAQFSRWCYVFFGLYFLTITMAGWSSVARRLGFDFIFFATGLVFLWTFLTSMLVVFGTETIVTQDDMDIPALGWQLVGLAFVHYAPIVIVVIYLFDQRSRAAKYWAKLTRTMVRCGTWAVVVFYYGVCFWSPLALAVVYRILFDPFAAYDLDPVPYSYMWIEIFAVLFVPVVGFALLLFLYFDPHYRESLKV